MEDYNFYHITTNDLHWDFDASCIRAFPVVPTIEEINNYNVPGSTARRTKIHERNVRGIHEDETDEEQGGQGREENEQPGGNNNPTSGELVSVPSTSYCDRFDQYKRIRGICYVDQREGGEYEARFNNGTVRTFEK